jgi:hypothetical protein
MIAAPVQLSDGFAADDIQLAAFEAHAESAGALGFYRDDASGTLVTLVSKTDSAFDLTQLGSASVPVRLEYTDLTAAAVAQASDRLLALPASLSTGKDSMGFFFNPEEQKFDVTATFDAAAVFNALGDSAALINYQNGKAEALSRDDDYPAYWGGARTHWAGDPNYTTNWCTTSFTTVDGTGVRHMIQPAHCGPVGATVKTWTSTHTVGTYGHKRCGNIDGTYNSDIQWISGQSYSKSIYVGGAAGTEADVREAGTPAVGASYRYSGATTYENANQVVISTDASLWWDTDNDFCNPEVAGGWWQLHLISWNRAGVCDAQGGDSGAPFYVKYAGTPPTIGIRGMATARLGNVCYGEKWSRISSLMGVSIYTG